MASHEIVRQLTPEQRALVGGLMERVRFRTGFRPLSDQAWILFKADHPQHRVSILQWAADSSRLEGYAQLDEATDSNTVEVVVEPGDDSAPVTVALLTHALAAVGALSWWAFHVTDTHHDIARAVGLVARRSLLQMRCSLPLDRPWQLDTRPFVPGEDDDRWLRVNNRAFAWHPEQSDWTTVDLHERMAEPWFDADGFLVHDVDGEMAGFCWTKLHTDTKPPEGEIYVIAVDPDFGGRGLGRALTLAGLHSIAQRGITSGMLFVDETNVAAVALYRKLGFHVARTDRMFTTITGTQP